MMITEKRLSSRLGVYVAQTKNESGIQHTDELLLLRISTYVAAAFVKYSHRVENAFGVLDMETLRQDARDFNCGYVVQPVILNLRGRNCTGNEMNTAPAEAHQLSLRLDIHDAESGEQLSSESFQVTGSYDRPGNQCPCDLITEPLEELTFQLYS